VTIIPYLLGMVNVLGYPAALDGGTSLRPSARVVVRHLVETLRQLIGRVPLRRLMLESMGFEGFFKSAGNYLQPILLAAAVVATASILPLESFNEAQRASLLVGPVYLVLHSLSAVASRNSHRLVGDSAGEERASLRLWRILAVVCVVVTPALYWEWYPLMILGFVALHFLHDLWRPVLISRFDSQSSETQGATLLSAENQAKSVGTMLLAPLLGILVDLVRVYGPGGQFWPIGLVGIILAFSFSFGRRDGKRGAGPSLFST
jgi:hypothetical protein